MDDKLPAQTTGEGIFQVLEQCVTESGLDWFKYHHDQSSSSD
jgi:hypothetical protein